MAEIEKCEDINLNQNQISVNNISASASQELVQGSLSQQNRIFQQKKKKKKFRRKTEQITQNNGSITSINIATNISREDRKIQHQIRMMENNYLEKNQENQSNSIIFSKDKQSPTSEESDDKVKPSLDLQISKEIIENLEEFKIENKKRSELDPLNPEYNLGQCTDVFFYLYDYQENEKNKLQNMANQRANKFQIKPISQYRSIKIAQNQILDQTNKIQYKVNQKFQEQKHKLNTIFNKSQSEFSQNYINDSIIKQFIKSPI